MEIIYTRKAKRDLQDIREYYGPRSPSGLQNIVSDVIGVVEDIPYSLSKGRQSPNPDVWEKITPKYKYVIPYYLFQGQLFVLRVYDTSRGTLNYDEIVDLRQ